MIPWVQADLNPGISGVGIGLRLPHLDRVLAEKPEIPWLEVLADNHLVAGGPLIRKLEKLREDYPLTLHCVGMSLGGTDPLDLDYLTTIRSLADRLDVTVVSDHLCFTRADGHAFPDLLPLPYTEEALAHVADRVTEVQARLGRRILVENVSAYLAYRDSTIPEGEFLDALAEQADCGLLVDVNNAYVNEINLGTPVEEFLAALPPHRIGQAHLAGYEDRGDFLLDAHSRPVSDAVWMHFEAFCKRFPGVPTLIEWDNDLPELAVLCEEALKAQSLWQAAMPSRLEAGCP